MNDAPNLHVRRLTTAALVAAGIAVALGAVTLIALAFNLESLRTLNQSVAAMKVNAAVCFVLVGSGLYARTARDRTFVWDRVGIVLGVMCAMIGFATLVEYAAHVNLGIDQLFGHDASMHGLIAPGRMAQATALDFTLLGAGVALLDVEIAGKRRPSQWLALLAGAIAFLAVIGHAYNVRPLYAVGSFASLALHTALGLGVTATGVLFARSDKGLMARTTGDQSAGVAARRMLPAVIATPITLSVLRLAGQRAGYYGTDFGLALHTTANVICLAGLTWWTVGALRRLEAERDRAHRELANREQDLAITLDSIGDAVIATDAEGRVTRMNPVAESLTGRTIEDACGQPLSSVLHIVHEDTRQPVESPVDRVLREGVVVGLANHTVLIAEDGDERPIADSAAPIRDASGAIRGVVLVFRDQTAAREQQRALVRSLELTVENRRIQEADRMKSVFLANMSHELRTPLNAILGFTELLHDHVVPPDSAQHDQYLQHIEDSGRHLLRLINDVLDLAKIEAGKLDFHAEPTHLRTVVEEVVSIVRRSATAKRLSIGVGIDEALDRVLLDPARLKQILYNYLSNAIKFTGEGGSIEVSVRAIGRDALRLEVQDTGVGIAEEDLARLFVDFQQLDAGAATRQEGTGLGLALTKRLVEAQGGSVGVTSELGRGSVFYAILPIGPLQGS